MEKIIKIKGTIFEILVEVHKMTHIKDNTYIDPVDKKWTLTPYGFVSNIQYAEGVKTAMLTKEIKKYKGIIRETNETLRKNKIHIGALKAEITNLKDEKKE